MKVLVCGGRDFKDAAYLENVLDKLHQERGFTEVIQGGAKGADYLAKFWAVKRNIFCVTYPADWHLHGKAAGMIRNREMIKTKPDLVVAFPGGRGTANMVKLAHDHKVEVIECP